MSKSIDVFRMAEDLDRFVVVGFIGKMKILAMASRLESVELWRACIVTIMMQIVVHGMLDVVWKRLLTIIFIFSEHLIISRYLLKKNAPSGASFFIVFFLDLFFSLGGALLAF